MQRDIIVIGGSAGSLGAVKSILQVLPKGLPITVFVVIHLSPDYPSALPLLLTNAGPFRATSPKDQESIQQAHIYVAPPDHHITIEAGKIRVLRGPRENRHRPAIDPLFRSAAREFGPRVIGIVLSGLRDDGSAGLYAIKKRGGITIVQDPGESPWHDMPRNAIQYADPHFIWRAEEIGRNLPNLAELSERTAAMSKSSSNGRRTNRKKSPRGSAEPVELQKQEANMATAWPAEGEGTPSVFACPECHGVLWELKDDKMVRFRCRVGHSYSEASLTQEMSAASENALWAAVRALEEKAALQRRVAEGMGHDRRMGSRLLDQSESHAANARLIRDMIFRRDAELETEQAEERKAS